MIKRGFGVGFALGLTLFAARGLAAAPEPLPLPPALPSPVDESYRGQITLDVDVTDLDRRIISVAETLPVRGPGPLILLYPEWLPGNHAPRGALDKLAGLTITANGKSIPWTRDPVNVFAFHLDVPPGVSTLDLRFQYLSPTAPDQGRIVMTQEIVNLQWNSVALYPAGYYMRRIPFAARLRRPSGWAVGTALEVQSQTDTEVQFASTDFETLVDSPLMIGKHAAVYDLDPGGRSSVKLHVFADRADLAEASPVQIAAHRTMVAQADLLFGARPYDHYDFLLSVSDRLGTIGLEHQRSSENGTASGYFADWGKTAAGRYLLPHEYVHAWNGKSRRPADLYTADFATPMGTSLLWVYEGQTQYWGYVLSARAGLHSRQEALDSLALIAATYEVRNGRNWRSLADTTSDPIVSARAPKAWTSWQRSEDYYSEGLLVWLDIDTRLRAMTGGHRSLDDFARSFFGVRDGAGPTLTYRFEDVVAALNALVPADWASLLRARLNTTGAQAPLEGLERGGYKLIYTDEPSPFAASQDARRKMVDLTYSLGLTMGRDGQISAVQWQGPAFGAGLTVGNQLIAVNGLAYDPETLKSAIRSARGGTDPIELIVKSGDRYRVVRIDYHGGLRFPRLERIAGVPALIDDIFSPKK